MTLFYHFERIVGKRELALIGARIFDGELTHLVIAFVVILLGGLGVGKSFGLIEGMDDIMAGIGFTEVMEGVGQGKEDTMVIEIQGTGDLENQNFLNGNNPPVVSGGNEINSPYDGMNGQPPVIS